MVWRSGIAIGAVAEAIGKEPGVFRRRMFLARRRFLGRPRLLGAALLGGLGFAAGRASRPTVPQGSSPSEDWTVKLRELSDLHASGALTDQEYAAAKSKLLAT